MVIANSFGANLRIRDAALEHRLDDLVGCFSGNVTGRRIRTGGYSGDDDRERAMEDWLLVHKTKPKPFVCIQSAGDIPAPGRPAERWLAQGLER